MTDQRPPTVLQAETQCSFGECKNFATYQVIGKLWAFGHDKASHPPAEMQTTLGLCEDHKAEIKEIDLFVPEGRRQIREGFRAAGLAPPDFDSAEVVAVPIIRGHA